MRFNNKTKYGKRVRYSLGDRIVDGIIYVVLGLIALCTVLPFVYVMAGSFATEKELTEKAFFIIPEVWSLNAYRYAVRTANILRGLRNSLIQASFKGAQFHYKYGDCYHALWRGNDPFLSGVLCIWVI